MDLGEVVEALLQDEEEAVDALQKETHQNLHDHQVAHQQVLQDLEYHLDHDHHDRALHEEEVDLGLDLSQEVREETAGIEVEVLGEGDNL